MARLGLGLFRGALLGLALALSACSDLGETPVSEGYPSEAEAEAPAEPPPAKEAAPAEPAPAEEAPPGAPADDVIPPGAPAAANGETHGDAGAAAPPPPPPASPPSPPPPPPPRRAEAAAPAPASPSRGIGSSTGRRPAEIALPPFPWPPPQPSAREAIERAALLGGDSSASLGAVGRRIQAALRAAGYTEHSFYSAPGGFALVARLERMRADGTPEPGQFRFLAPSAEEPFSLTSYISRLFFAPEGFYRQIVFIATDKPFVASAPAPTAEEAQELLLGGGDRLPAAYDRRSFSENHAVSALIYEFKKNPADRDVETLRPGRLAGAQHLEKAGIRFGAGP